MSKFVLASGLSIEAKEKLAEFGFEIIEFCYNNSVDPRVAHHADLSFLDCGDGTLFIAREMAQYRDFFENLGYNVHILNENLGKEYPNDVRLNCVPLGDCLLCNIDTVSSDVLQYFSNRKIINVRQGYTKCSVIPVNGHAIITDDESISKQCMANGIDVLYVSKGAVALSGFDYGFIGGASGKISDTEIAFNGDILTHPDGEKITDFLKKHKKRAVSLAKGQLNDIGSIIALVRRNKSEEK